MYMHVTTRNPQQPIFQACLDYLQVKPVVSERDLQKIPASGPLVMVANHPFGGLEGLILGACLSHVRPRLKILGNAWLQAIPELREWLIPVNPFGSKRAIAANALALKAAIRWVQAGGALITFPAGEVSHVLWTQAGVTDGVWSPHIGAIIRRAQATVLPVFFPGRNSLLFQSLGLLHPRLRTLLLPRELMNKRYRTVPVAVGQAIVWRKLARFQTDTALMAPLRLATYSLDRRLARRSITVTSTPPVAAPVPSAQLQQDMIALPPAQRLVDGNDLVVYIAHATQIPAVLQEIGRLRERTFRAVHEGSGQPVDLDRFDAYYLHLFVWNPQRHEVVGAYRLGRTDVILQQHGTQGLYTSTLFRFQPGFFRQSRQTIELGRAFIREEYQRQHGCLWLLWRGIAAFLGQHPQYTRLFGPVSISQDYHLVSKHILVQFLREHCLDPDLARYVRPRSPFRGKAVSAHDVQALRALLCDIDDVSLLIASLEDGKGVPVLLRYYLGLGATLLGVNLDRKFSDVVDGLLLVDLTRTDPRLLRRVMGPESFARYTARHGHRLSTAV